MGNRVRVTGHGLRLLCFGTVGALVTLWVVAQTHAQARQAPTVSGDRLRRLGVDLCSGPLRLVG